MTKGCRTGAISASLRHWICWQTNGNAARIGNQAGAWCDLRPPTVPTESSKNSGLTLENHTPILVEKKKKNKKAGTNTRKIPEREKRGKERIQIRAFGHGGKGKPS